jgi:hypothetical protein
VAAVFLAAGAAGCGGGGAGEQYSRELLHALDQGKVIGTKGNMETLSRALSAYSIDRGGYPPGSTIQQATAALVPAFLPSAVATDAWGNTFDYRSDGRSFTLTAPSADGRAGTDDDLVMVDGRFTHLPAPTPS